MPVFAYNPTFQEKIDNLEFPMNISLPSCLNCLLLAFVLTLLKQNSISDIKYFLWHRWVFLDKSLLFTLFYFLFIFQDDGNSYAGDCVCNICRWWVSESLSPKSILGCHSRVLYLYHLVLCHDCAGTYPTAIYSKSLTVILSSSCVQTFTVPS